MRANWPCRPAKAALTDSDRRSLAIELRHRFDELLGIANATDGAGQYLFSGYMGDTKPFAGTVGSGASYAGDEGQRHQQVTASRQLAVSESGNDVFMRIPAGNGTFSTAVSGSNAGTGVIDGGAILNPANWAAGNVPATGLEFGIVPRPATSTYRQRQRECRHQHVAADGADRLRARPGHPPVKPGAAPAFDYGSQVVITGQPANGDTFSITPGGSQSLFATLENLIAAVEAPVGANNALLTNRLGAALTNLDQGMDSLLRVRASIGARMNELDALGSVGEDLNLQYQQTLSRLQDVDYAEAISNLTQQQTYLEAAQKSYLRVAGLSLFNYV
ncbi:MAG: flagellar hook-associated protein FlgL [Betaproteobacteria bacterium]|nr:flagellar hook-associated protein FlgL [Betaproteobacteria bacterium]